VRIANRVGTAFAFKPRAKRLGQLKAGIDADIGANQRFLEALVDLAQLGSAGESDADAREKTFASFSKPKAEPRRSLGSLGRRYFGNRDWRRLLE
jgi:hypothetical protein